MLERGDCSIFEVCLLGTDYITSQVQCSLPEERSFGHVVEAFRVDGYYFDTHGVVQGVLVGDRS